MAGICSRTRFDVPKINPTENATNQLQEDDILRSPHGHIYISTMLTSVPTNVVNHPTPRGGSVPSIHLKTPPSSRRRSVDPALVEISIDRFSPFSVNLKLPTFCKPPFSSSPQRIYPSISSARPMYPWIRIQLIGFFGAFQCSRGISPGRGR